MLTGKRLQYLADLLPENVSWGDPLNALMLDQILAAHSAGAQPKGAGMQAQMIASRICSALEVDKDDGYDLEAGLFGKALSALIRELAAMSLSTGAQEPVGVVHRPAPNGDDFSVEWLRPPENGARLYAHPQPMSQTDAAREFRSITDWESHYFPQKESDMQQIQIPSLAEGEIYLGGFVNANGDVTHTILLPGDNAGATWQEQMAWAKSVGGDLPTRAELVIAYEQHRDQFQQTEYWSNTPDDYPGYSAYAWYQHFIYGYQSYTYRDYSLRARRVRRVIVKGE